MTDVFILQTSDDGDLRIQNGDIVLTDGIETAVYLSLFGGNDDDSGGENDKNSWWGNLDEPNINAHVRSETQFLLTSLPPFTGNVSRISAAVLRDTAWMITLKHAIKIEVQTVLISLNRVKITLDILLSPQKNIKINLVENWDGA